MPEIRSTKYSPRCAFASHTGSRVSHQKFCFSKCLRATGTSSFFMKRSRSLVRRQIPVYFCNANAPATAWGTPCSFNAVNTSLYRALASGGRGAGRAEVNDELSGILNVLGACSAMKGLDVLLFEAVAETLISFRRGAPES